ncbi:UPF0149 family protein [Pseudoalteromonas rubra]|uniref:Tetratricopeptide repeat protein n=1 Tax=Pseudoalteromonas rubra TaxID=43658 RepID=A0A5S3X692_9GAMM|nr:UPF0149 family protein [Pseudoalteromonas rubra]TMP39554.1 hypothetical protein CWB98_02905 [Pseudoalteromonas rubra]
MSIQLIKKAVKALSANSELQPDILYIEGYLMGLGVALQPPLPSEWLEHLFGHYELDNTKPLEAVMDFQAICMRKMIRDDNALPKSCVLSKSDPQESLQTGKPLPLYCMGMLRALTWINMEHINAEQRQQLQWLKEVLRGFTSYEKAQKEFDDGESDFAKVLIKQRRMIPTYVANTAYAMRFADDMVEVLGEYGITDEEMLEQANEVFNEMLEEVLDRDDEDAIAEFDGLVEKFEANMITPDFVTENMGVFWKMHETRPYMMLRAKRAHLNLSYGHADKAAKELQDLLQLNPNDNQGNRYVLLNCLIVMQDWAQLRDYLGQFSECSTFTQATHALMLFATEGDSAHSREAKRALKDYNSHFQMVATGQKKAKPYLDTYLPGSEEEVDYYLEAGGKKAWLSVEGSLFWLRQK